MKKISLTQKIKKIFIAGILTALPIVVTVYLLLFLYNLIISKASPLVKKIAHQYDFNFGEYTFQLLTILIILILIFLIGIFTRLYFGKLFIKIIDKIMANIPIAKSIYNALKQVVDSFSGTGGNSFSKVCLVEFPRREMWMLAFIVKDSLEFMTDVTTKEDSSNVFIPTAPNPTSGFVAVIPNKDIKELDITVEDGIKFVLSIGILNFNKKDSDSIEEEAIKTIKEKIDSENI